MNCVLLVDSHSVFREALAKILEWQDVLDVKALGAGSLSEARGRKAMFGDCLEVAVIELSLPDGDGVELIKELREFKPDLPIMVLTKRKDEISHRRALEAGAEKVLTKWSPLQDIIEALRQLSDKVRYELDVSG